MPSFSLQPLGSGAIYWAVVRGTESDICGWVTAAQSSEKTLIVVNAARVAGIFLLASLYLSAQQNIATKTTRCKSEAAEWVFLLSSETQVGRAFVELTPVPSSAVLLATPDPTTLPDFVDTQQLTVAEWVSCVDTERLERAQDVGTEECRLAAGLEGALISRGASKNL